MIEPDNLLSANDLGVWVGPTQLIGAIDLTVVAGEWVSVIGPNGAGKTTLLRALAGITPYFGSVRVAGLEVSAASPRALAHRLALVVQSPIVPERITVRDLVLLGRTAHLGWLQSEGRHDHWLVDRMLARLALEPLAARDVATLSGGELQRVLLARALVQEPQLLLLDEPTSALDLGHQMEVLDLVDQLRREHGVTVVSTMHDLSLAGEFADRLVLLDRGRIARQGPPTEVLEADLVERIYRTPVTVLPPDPAQGRHGPVVLQRRPVRPSRPQDR